MLPDIKIGEFQKFHYPKPAKHALNSYIKAGKFYCPQCNKESEYEQKHGDAYRCGKCGLMRQSYGNSLYTWGLSIKEIRKEKLIKIMNNIKKLDIKKLGIPNLCFSLTDADDSREELYSKQRIERGFDDSETWSLRDTIGNFTLPRLKRFREITPTHSDKPEYPGELSRTEWHEALDKMIIAFELLVRDKGTFILTNEEEKQYKEGMDLFHEHFLGLWW